MNAMRLSLLALFLLTLLAYFNIASARFTPCLHRCRESALRCNARHLISCYDTYYECRKGCDSGSATITGPDPEVFSDAEIFTSRVERRSCTAQRTHLLGCLRIEQCPPGSVKYSYYEGEQTRTCNIFGCSNWSQCQ